MIDTTKIEQVIVCLEKDGKRVQMSEQNRFGSQILLPLIVKLLKKEKAAFADLSEIKVARGPGSYTGLRVGVSVANALGFTLNISVNNKKMETELKYS